MARPLTCPRCSAPFQVPESLLGQEVRCPACRQILQSTAEGVLTHVPTATPPEPAPPSGTPPDAAEAPPQSARVVTDPEGEFIPCPFCAELISGHSMYCEFCGERLDHRPRFFRRDVEPHRGGVIMLLGILSLVGIAGVVTCQVFNLIGIGLGAAAWIMGNRDLARIMRGEMDPSGQNQTKTGRNCGMVGLIINIALALACAGLLLIIAGASAFR